jgi:uncharacterized protein (DUF1697 family)
MTTYLLLLRGINVGGKNKIKMAALKQCLEEAGCTNVVTYIQSGNVIVQSALEAHALRQRVEALLPLRFVLDTAVVKVLVLTRAQFERIVEHKPAGFGEQPDHYHSDVIFLIDMDAPQAISVLSPREGVDSFWAGDGAIYAQRLSAQLAKSKLNKVIGTPVYERMTVRNWNTTTKLLDLIRTVDTPDAP